MEMWEFNCKNCGNESKKPKWVSKIMPKFCSRNCYYYYKKFNPNKKRHVFECLTCEKLVERNFFLKKKPKQKYCSLKCRPPRGSIWEYGSNEDKKKYVKKFYEKYVVKIKNSCWGWEGNINPKGYGGINFSKKAIGIPRHAHRISWWINKGEIPEGKIICHHCDNPLCSNPDHLYLGTHQTNADDKVRRGRCVNEKGSKSVKAKLNEQQAIEIKRMLKEGMSPYKISKHFPITAGSIYSILYDKTWKHIPWPK